METKNQMHAELADHRRRPDGAVAGGTPWHAGKGGQVEQADFSCVIRQSENTAVLSLSGELDLMSSAELRQGIAEAISSGAPACVVIDLAELAFCDSSGLNALIFAVNSVEAAGGRLVLSGTQGRIARLFSVTGLNRRFQSYDTVGEAMAALPGSRKP